MTVRAPFPWFGGKSRAAHLIWPRFGNVRNYVEPFAGSLAVLLARPTPPHIETVNDRDCYIANFWRAIQSDPIAVAKWADWPVNEADLHARHQWLVNRVEFVELMKTDPEYFDAKVAGWWVNGLDQWIGGGWCQHPSWKQIPYLRSEGQGIHQSRKLPHLDRGGRGIHSRIGVQSRQKPDLAGDSGAAGRGIHASGQRGRIVEWFTALRDRLRHVRVCCGHWDRVLGPSVTTKIGVTAILFDPPYGAAAARDSALYAQDSLTVAHEVRKWAIEHGDDPKLRIALCGYEGEHDDMPPSWKVVSWKAAGGYGNQRRLGEPNENAARERLWFSPHCLPAELPLFEAPAC